MKDQLIKTTVDMRPVVLPDEYLNALAGSTAGIFASLVVCPLDVVKTRLQGQVHIRGEEVKYKGTLSTLALIFRDEGIAGCYRGLSPTLLGMIPTWATYFTSYNALKQRFDKVSLCGGNQSLVHMFSACGAGMLTATVTNPIWVVKTRIQMKASGECQYKGTRDAFAKIVSEEGLAGLYKGLGPSLLGVSHITIQFPLYEYLKKEIANMEAQDDPFRPVSVASLTACAATSKILASCFTYPHDVVRTRMIIDKRPEAGLLRCYVKLWREGGVQALYRGFLTNCLKVVPASAVTFVSYEVVYGLLHNLYGDRQFRPTPSVVHKEVTVAQHK